MTAPNTAAVGKPISASNYNQIVTRLSAGTAFTPTISNWASATTGPTTTGRYWRTGDVVHMYVQSKLGTGAITVGNITVTVPTTYPIDTTNMSLDASTTLAGNVGFYDISATQLYIGMARPIDTATIRLMRPPLSGTGVYPVTSSTTPFTWATLDELSILISYPTA